MYSENLKELSGQRPIKKKGSLGTGRIIDAMIIGVTVGIFIYGVTENGFGFFTFFPLMIGYLIIRNFKNNDIPQLGVGK